MVDGLGAIVSVSDLLSLMSDSMGGTNFLRGHRGPSPELSLENWGPKREESRDWTEAGA